MSAFRTLESPTEFLYERIFETPSLRTQIAEPLLIFEIPSFPNAKCSIRRSTDRFAISESVDFQRGAVTISRATEMYVMHESNRKCTCLANALKKRSNGRRCSLDTETRTLAYPRSSESLQLARIVLELLSSLAKFSLRFVIASYIDGCGI